MDPNICGSMDLWILSVEVVTRDPSGI